MVNLVAMVPARSGSVGIKNKNLVLLGGRPLIEYSIQPAVECPEITSVYINSDSGNILEVGVNAGAKAFWRKPEFSDNHTSMRDVILDFITVLADEDVQPDGIVVMYPTYPFRSAGDLSEIARQFYQLGADRSMIGFKKPETHPYLCFDLDTSNNPKMVANYDINNLYRRQDYPIYYELTMWVCIVPTAGVKSLNAQLMNDHTYGYIVPYHARTVDIDTPDDLEYAEFLIHKEGH